MDSTNDSDSSLIYRLQQKLPLINAPPPQHLPLMLLIKIQIMYDTTASFQAFISQTYYRLEWLPVVQI